MSSDILHVQIAQASSSRKQPANTDGQPQAYTIRQTQQSRLELKLKIVFADRMRGTEQIVYLKAYPSHINFKNNCRTKVYFILTKLNVILIIAI